MVSAWENMQEEFQISTRVGQIAMKPSPRTTNSILIQCSLLIHIITNEENMMKLQLNLLGHYCRHTMKSNFHENFLYTSAL